MESINSVNVLAIDEERLKFRVIVSFDAQQGRAPTQRFGHYKFELPPLTSFANSNHYKQCTINLDGLSCTSGLVLNGAGNIPQAVGWSNGGVLGKLSAVEVSLSIPSSGTLVNKQFAADQAGTGQNNIGRFEQLVPLQIVKVGNSVGTTESLVGGNDVGTGASAWQGEGLGGAIMTGNPFGGPVEVKFSRPDLPQKGGFGLADAAFPAVDVGIYTLQFSIQMIPNK